MNRLRSIDRINALNDFFRLIVAGMVKCVCVCARVR